MGVHLVANCDVKIRAGAHRMPDCLGKADHSRAAASCLARSSILGHAVQERIQNFLHSPIRMVSSQISVSA